MHRRDGQPLGVLIIVENNWVPFDRRVWSEATALRDHGCRVRVLCPMDSLDSATEARSEVIDGIEVHRFPLAFAAGGIRDFLREYIGALFHIAILTGRLWRVERFDLIHICNPPDIFFPIGLWYRFLGAKFIFDHHDLFPENVLWRYRGLPGRLLYGLSRLMEVLTHRSANVVIATNESYSLHAQERSRIPAKKIVIVRNGPRAAEFMPVAPIPEFKRGFPFMACFVGMMGNEDGIRELSEIIAYTVRELKRTDILFTLIGDGPELRPALDRLRSLGLEHFVDARGLIRDDFLLRQYMSTADVFLSPEPWTPMNDSSTFIKIGEYMSMAKPIVAFDLRETRNTAMEAAHYAAPGNIAEFSNILADLIDDPRKRDQMGTAGRQRVLRELCWERQQLHLFEAYELAVTPGISGLPKQWPRKTD